LDTPSYIVKTLLDVLVINTLCSLTCTTEC